MTLMRFDPFRELDRLAEQTLSAGARAQHSMPYTMQGGRRDFFAVTAMRPQHHEIVVDDEVADQAARLLGSGT